MTEQNLIRLSDVEIVLDELNNDVYIDFKILSLKLEEAFEKSKKLQAFFNKNIIFKFNGWYFEVTEKTTMDQVKSAYKFQEQFSEELHHINHVNTVIQNTINKLEEQNIKATIEAMNDKLLLNKPESIYKPYVKLYDQKKLVDKFYRLYRQNHNSEKIDLLPPQIEIPKIKIKK